MISLNKENDGLRARVVEVTEQLTSNTQLFSNNIETVIQERDELKQINANLRAEIKKIKSSHTNQQIDKYETLLK